MFFYIHIFIRQPCLIERIEIKLFLNEKFAIVWLHGIFSLEFRFERSKIFYCFQNKQDDFNNFPHRCEFSPTLWMYRQIRISNGFIDVFYIQAPDLIRQPGKRQESRRQKNNERN